MMKADGTSVVALKVTKMHLNTQQPRLSPENHLLVTQGNQQQR